MKNTVCHSLSPYLRELKLLEQQQKNLFKKTVQCFSHDFSFFPPLHLKKIKINCDYDNFSFLLFHRIKR